MKNFNQIIIHHAATPPDMDIGVDEIREWHVDDNGWSDIGYHFVIRRDGTLEAGRPLNRAGAHTRGHNKDSIGICMVGTGPEFTRHQWSTLEHLVLSLKTMFPGIDKVKGHNDYTDKKPCPGFNVPAWFDNK